MNLEARLPNIGCHCTEKDGQRVQAIFESEFRLNRDTAQLGDKHRISLHNIEMAVLLLTARHRAASRVLYHQLRQ